ncbi:hypothetical protein [Wolbachia endosymbiont (group A) of Colletes cunicularius]
MASIETVFGYLKNGYARSLLLVNVLWLYGKFIAIQLILKAI